MTYKNSLLMATFFVATSMLAQTKTIATVEKLWSGEPLGWATADTRQWAGFGEYVYWESKANHTIYGTHDGVTVDTIYTNDAIDGTAFCLDDAGNFIVEGTFPSTPSHVFLLKHDTTAHVDIAITGLARTDIVTATGDVFSPEGGFVFLYGNSANLLVLAIKNAAAANQEVIVKEIAIAGSNVQNYVIAGDTTVQYVQRRSSGQTGFDKYENGVNVGTIAGMTGYKGSTLSGAMVTLGGKLFAVYPVGSVNYSSEFSVVDLTNGILAVDKADASKTTFCANTTTRANVIDVGIFANATKIDDNNTYIQVGNGADGTALFKLTITAAAEVSLSCNEAQGRVEGGGLYPENEVITIRAIANEGYKFVRWSDGSTDAERTIILSQDISLIAEFTAYSIIASGTCGPNLTWQLSSDSVLTISGTGRMDNYVYLTDFAPWYGKRLKISSIVIGNSVTSIGEWAFYECSSLISVTIGNSVTSIGKCAFYGCSSLPSITISNSVTSIGINAFSDCNSLTSIVWNAINCSDFNISSETTRPFYSIRSNITSFIFSDNVRYIPAHLCAGMNNLTSITIPDSVTSIGYGAFSDCSSLISVTIPNNVTSIKPQAFSDCSSLTSITIGNGVTSIEGSAFKGCSSLISVTIGNNVTNIGGMAFLDCNNLPSVTIPNSVTTIGDYAFYNCSSLISVTIPNSVTTIGAYAYYGCSSLTSIVWNAINCSNSISTSPFYSSCSNITSFVFGDGVQCIPEYLCDSMNKLTSIVIPNSVTSIGHSAFRDCGSLTSVTIIGNCVTSIGWHAFENCSSLISVTIPNTVTTIGEYAFYNCSSLTSVTIPERVKSIGNRTFYNCNSLESVTIGNSVTSIGNSAFSGCSSLTSVVIPNSVTSIGKCAFYDCNGLTSVTIPNSVTSIEDYTFQYCSSLTSVTIPECVTSIGISAFQYCNSLTSITIPERVTSIGNDAFCAAIDTIVWNAQNCNSAPFSKIATRIKSVTFGNSVEQIPASLCSGMTRLTTISLGENIRTIGDSAFYNCYSLRSIYNYRPTPTNVGGDTFGEVDKFLCTLYVPAGSGNMYRFATGWKDFYNIIEFDATGVETFSKVEDVKEFLSNPETQVFTLQGYNVTSIRNNLPSGIYILRLKDKSYKVSIR